jgi:hypothetical protein
VQVISKTRNANSGSRITKTTPFFKVSCPICQASYGVFVLFEKLKLKVLLYNAHIHPKNAHGAGGVVSVEMT